MYNNDHDAWSDGPTTIDGTIFGDQPPSETTLVRIERVHPNPKGLSSVDLRAYCGSCCSTTHAHLTGKEIFRSLAELTPEGDSSEPLPTWDKPAYGSVSCNGCGNTLRYSIGRHEMQPQSIIGSFLLSHVDQLRALRHKKDAPRRAWQRAKAYIEQLLQPHIATAPRWEDIQDLRFSINKRVDHLARSVDTRDKQRSKAMWQISTALDEVRSTLDAFVKTQTTEPEKTTSVGDASEDTETKQPKRHKRSKSKARSSSPTRRHKHERKD
jgi:hypothetical protein